MPKRIQISTSMSPEIMTSLKVKAAQEGFPVNAILETLVTEYCTNEKLGILITKRLNGTPVGGGKNEGTGTNVKSPDSKEVPTFFKK